MTEQERFVSHLKRSAATVARWPVWKQTILGGLPMTMPHLMNCPHSDDSWCLACVNDLHGKAEFFQEQLSHLLAAIHGDGGHHTAEVGEEQSVVDAINKWFEVRGAR